MPLLKVSLIFITIVAVSRYLKVRLWACILAGAAVLGFSFGMTPASLLYTFYRSTTSWKTIQILIILYGIAVFEYTLRISGTLNRLIVSLKKLLRDDRLVLGSLPAFLGFLPSPGGALFSAPLVEEAAAGVEITPEQKSFVNYWFRHVWEVSFPLFPGLILAASVSGLPLYGLARKMLPMVAVNIATGCLVVFHTRFRVAGDAARPESRFRLSAVAELLKNLFPILFIICGALFFKMDIILLIALAIAWTFFQVSVGPATAKKIFVDTLYSQNLMLIVAIMAFAEALNDSGAAVAIPKTFVDMNFPVFMIFMGMPFVLGIFTGINTAFVGLSFPILAGMAGGHLTESQVSLAYLSGTAGIMLSPVHLCFILTQNYFKANLLSIYRMLFFPVAAMLAGAAIIGRAW